MLLGVAIAIRADVESYWRELIAGKLTRKEVHAWAAPWVEGAEDCDDPIVGIGLQHLYGFDLSRPTGPAPVLQKHGGGAGRIYLRSGDEIAAELERWQQDARAFDHDADEWRRDRLQRLFRSMLHEGRVIEARQIRGMLRGSPQGPGSA